MRKTYLDTFIKIIQNPFISDMYKGCVGDMGELGITESLSVKRQVLMSASEAAEMILRVDDILKAAPRKRTNDTSHC
jgi:T-complex protein 1 subunit beta